MKQRIKGGNSMKRYEEPKLEVERFEMEDVITTSGSNDLELPDQPLP